MIYFCGGFSCCPCYRVVRNSEVSARRELAELFYSLESKVYFVLRCKYFCGKMIFLSIFCSRSALFLVEYGMTDKILITDRLECRYVISSTVSSPFDDSTTFPTFRWASH